MRAALLFGALFIGMMIVTHLVVVYLGKAGVYTLAALMGFTDVDPFIMGMTQSGGANATLTVAAAAILIAAASNNIAKAFYAHSFGDRQTGRQSFLLLLGLAAAGLVPLLWIAR